MVQGCAEGGGGAGDEDEDGKSDEDDEDDDEWEGLSSDKLPGLIQKARRFSSPFHCQRLVLLKKGIKAVLLTSIKITWPLVVSLQCCWCCVSISIIL